MKNYLPGDRVSFINDKLSGTIKRIIDKKQVLLLLDDGFEIPASTNELVVIEKAKGNDNIQDTDQSIIAEDVDKSDKIFFGAVAEDTGKGTLIKTYLINTTPNLIQFSLFNRTMSQIKGLAHGELEASRAIKLVQFSINEATDFKNLVFYYISFSENPKELIPPQQINFKLRSVSLIKDQKLIPVLKQKGLLINLTDQQQVDDNDETKKILAPPKVNKPEPIPDLIDLHIEELTDSPKALEPHAAFELQMKVFNNSLEKALAQDLNHITYIHGIGQGRLKGEIRKVLGLNPYIQSFEDADHKKFGYGATIVYLKNR
jgi:hypothetical protein